MPEAKKGANRPLPRSLDAWSREVRGITRMLEELPALVDDNGAMWVKKVKAYNLDRLKVLRQNKPKKK